MKMFTDADGGEWSLSINTTVLKRIKSLLNIDLLDIVDGKVIDRLHTDPILLVDVIYVAIMPEAEIRKITDSKFGESMRGDAIASATEALLEELVAFSPSPRSRKILGQIWEKQKEAESRIFDVIDAKMESGVLDKAIDKAVREAETFGATSTEPRASSESTPDP